MIDKVWFRNYKLLRSVELDLERLTVLVGPNASGKSTVLEGIQRMRSELMRDGNLDPMTEERTKNSLRISRTPVDVPPADQPLSDTIPVIPVERGGNWSPDLDLMMTRELPVLVLGLQGRFDGEPCRAELRLKSNQQTKMADAWLRHWARESTPLTSSTNTQLPTASQDIVALKHRPDRLAAPANSHELKPRMEEDGSGLAAVLAELKLNDSEIFDRIQERLKSIIPQVEKIRVQRAALSGASGPGGLNPADIGYEVNLDLKGAPHIPAHALSDGTLLTLGLLTELSLGSQTDRMVLIDDIGAEMHPRAIQEQMAQLRALLDSDPGLQIVATTHSPYLLDHLRPEEVYMTTLDGDGYTLLARMNEHPDFERWKAVMAPGEFWSSVGEDWIKKRQLGPGGRQDG